MFFEDRADPEADTVIVHELAHQWAGDLLSVHSWRDVWLNEGFATYAEWLWAEREGRGSAQAAFDQRMRQIPPSPRRSGASRSAIPAARTSSTRRSTNAGR